MILVCALSLYANPSCGAVYGLTDSKRSLPIRDPFALRPVQSFASINWQAEHALLRHRLVHGDTILKNLSLPAEYIQKVLQPIHVDSVSTWGIFLVKTNNGLKALKIIVLPEDMNHLTQGKGLKSRDQVILQMHLSELESSPGKRVSIPVDGVFDQNSIQDILSRFPDMYKDGRNMQASWGILMDYIPGGWNPKPPMNNINIKMQPPTWSRNWDLEKLIRKQMDDEIVLHRMGIRNLDPQSLIDREGTSYLFDLEFFQLLTPHPSLMNSFADIPFLSAKEILSPFFIPFYNSMSMSIRRTVSFLNPFFSYHNLSDEALRWHALNIVSHDSEVNPVLRDWAEAQLPLIPTPEHSESFGLAVRNVDSTLRSIYALQYMSFKFADLKLLESLVEIELRRRQRQ